MLIAISDDAIGVVRVDATRLAKLDSVGKLTWTAAEHRSEYKNE
jgi:hypothetical protein